MTFLEAANSGFMYFLVIAVILVVCMILIAFSVLAWREGKRVGVTRREVLHTVRLTVISSFGPLFAVLIPSIAMMAVLGVPWTWLRLSVLGGASQEMVIASLALSGGGFESLGKETSVEAFCMVAVCVGFIYCASPAINILFNKPLSKGMRNMENSKYNHLINILSNAAFLGVIIHICVNTVVNNVYSGNFIGMAVFLTGVLVCFIGETLIEKYHWKKIKEYSTAIYLVINMCTALVWNQLI